MRRRKIMRVALVSTVMSVVVACSAANIEGTFEALKQSLLDPSADRALLNAASAALTTTDAIVLGYEKSMEATQVKNRTVTRAISSYRKSRLGGLEGQLESAYETTVVIIESGIADEISEAATDPDFRRSWADVEPTFVKAQAYFTTAGRYHGYATTRFSVGAYFQGQEIKSGFSGDNDAAKFKSAVLGIKLLTQVFNIVPKLISNYEKLNDLDENLQAIPNYAKARQEYASANAQLDQVQLTQLTTEADKALESGEPVFTSLFASESGTQIAADLDARFSEETTLQADVSTKSSDRSASDFDGKLKDAGYCVRVQRALKDRKFYTGQIDGLCGRRSRKAVQAFNLSEGLGGSSTWTRDAEARLFKN